jgi:hypothetical protein
MDSSTKTKDRLLDSSSVEGKSHLESPWDAERLQEDIDRLFGGSQSSELHHEESCIAAVVYAQPPKASILTRDVDEFARCTGHCSSAE